MTKAPSPAASSLGLALVFALVATLPACADPDPSPTVPRTLQLSATAYVEAAPDEATFQLSLNCLKPSPASARDCLAEESAGLTAAMIALGVRPEHLQTTGVALNRDYTWRGNEQRFNGYRATTQVNVHVTALDSLPALYDLLLEQRRLELYGLQFGHSAADSLRSVASRRALAQTDALADSLLLAFPGTARRTLHVSNVEPGSALPQSGYAYETAAPVSVQRADAEQASVTVNNGLVRAEARVYVTYGF